MYQIGQIPRAAGRGATATNQMGPRYMNPMMSTGARMPAVAPMLHRAYARQARGGI